ncbi:hypothetical protein GCM10010336_43120 [Streptomyces goshikiensis]|nr:hypothetical protein GCM10010336_43120 [Streptomyces goshikiensis]
MDRADRLSGLTGAVPKGKSAPIKNHRSGRTSEILSMRITVRSSLAPARPSAAAVTGGSLTTGGPGGPAVAPGTVLAAWRRGA